MPSKSPNSRRYCFTDFKDELPFTTLPEFASYLVFQQELCPTTAKRHYQGYIVLKSPRRISYLKSHGFNNSVHFEISKGDSESNRAYCTKEDSRVAGPWEFGTLAEQGSSKRKTMELFETEPEELKLADPKKYRRCLAIVTNQRFCDVILPVFDRPWQVQLRSFIDNPPDDRTILWCYGSSGNEGKSTFAKKLIQEGWFYTRGGKADDVKYGYIDHGGSVVFDIPRDKEDYVNYALIEEIKDRIVTSNKYEPLSIHFSDRVHVVVMANFYPATQAEYDDKGRETKKCLISPDRVTVIECFVPINILSPVIPELETPIVPGSM